MKIGRNNLFVINQNNNLKRTQIFNGVGEESPLISFTLSHNEINQNTTKNEENISNILNINNKKKKGCNGRAVHQYYKDINHQRELMENLFLKLNLKTFEEWLKISTKKFKKNGGESLLVRHYKKDYKELLINIYPNYPWEFKNLKINMKINSLDENKEKMNKLFEKFQLNKLEDWLLVPSTMIYRNGGRNLLIKYENNIEKILSIIYENFPWKFQSKFHENIEKQREFMEEFFFKFKLNNLNDWVNLFNNNLNLFIDNGGESLLNDHYNGNFNLLLSSIYPNFSFDFKLEKKNLLKNLIEKQQKKMEKIYKKLKLNSLDDWLEISKKEFIKKGGNLLLKIYKGNFIKLLQKIYPNFAWHFSFNHLLKFFRYDKEKLLKIQKEFMDYLFIKFKLKSIDDWVKLNLKDKIIKNGGKRLFSYYKNDFSILLQSIYPFFPFNFNQLKINYLNHIFNNIFNDISPKLFFKSMKNQRNFMDYLFYRFKFKSLDNFMYIKKKLIKKCGGKILLKKYENNLNLIFNSIYPNFPFDFNNNKKIKLKKIKVNKLKLKLKKLKLKSRNNNKINKNYLIEYQRNKIDQLFIKYELKTINDWLLISNKKIIKKNMKKIFLLIYNENYKKFLQNIYPNYPWKFLNNIFNNISPKLYFKSKKNQRNFMDYLFKKLKLNSLDQFINIKKELLKKRIKKYGGKKLLKKYKNNLNLIFSSIYPNFPFDFINKSLLLNNINKKIQEKILEENQRKMDKLFIKFKLNSLNDWVNIPKNKFIDRGGEKIFNFYKGNFIELLQNIYPNFPWEISSFFRSSFPKFYFKSIENQKIFFDYLFKKLNLNSLDQFIKIKKKLMKKIIKKYGGKILLKKYENNLNLIFNSIYPNFPFDFIDKKLIMKKKIQQKIFAENQRKMDQLFIKFKLNSLNDWVNISKTKILKRGGEKLLFYYRGNKKELLQNIYPNFPWEFPANFHVYFPKYYFNSIENQREFMDNLFIKLNFNSLDNFINLKQNIIFNNGGKRLIENYQLNYQLILTTIYPNFPWIFSTNKSREFLYPKIKEWIIKYNILEKKDWYRLRVDYGTNFEVFSTVQYFFPSEKWKKSNFAIRNKKTTQRVLFSFTQMIFPTVLIIENYYHPKLFNHANFELDLFIPSLHLALEYQGQHHYDDIPGGFAGIELFRSRDEVKEKLALSLNIRIIYIPYWWDKSFSSLYSSINSNQLFSF